MIALFTQLHRLCWSLRNSTEERVDLEQDAWVGGNDDSIKEKGIQQTMENNDALFDPMI